MFSNWYGLKRERPNSGVCESSMNGIPTRNLVNQWVYGRNVGCTPFNDSFSTTCEIPMERGYFQQEILVTAIVRGASRLYWITAEKFVTIIMVSCFQLKQPQTRQTFESFFSM